MAGKCAVITGAGTGVGAATALLLAGRGYDVLINYRASAAAAEEVAGRCQALGVRAETLQGDVAEDADCRALAARAAALWGGRLDALVNSAGTTQFVSMADLDGLQAADFQRVFGVNVIGPFQVTRALAPLLRAASGAVVNVSSIAGQTGGGSSYAYAASKAALNTLTISLARNLAPEIRVNAVLPGFIEGRWLLDGLGAEAYARVRANFTDQAALGRVCTPEDVAQVIGWLLDGTNVITGQLITTDAGITLGRPPAVSR